MIKEKYLLDYDDFEFFDYGDVQNLLEEFEDKHYITTMKVLKMLSIDEIKNDLINNINKNKKEIVLYNEDDSIASEKEKDVYYNEQIEKIKKLNTYKEIDDWLEEGIEEGYLLKLLIHMGIVMFLKKYKKKIKILV
ncbi:MAG: hypothetical protein EOL97_14540 [Spirochaetia bacterium]|nr:hypothetical protein [Spirochaetia bacterium]